MEYIGVKITHLLNIDANFQRDIQVSAFFDMYLWPESGKLGGGVKYVTSTWGNDPIWLAHIFQVAWNHQLVNQKVIEVVWCVKL